MDGASQDRLPGVPVVVVGLMGAGKTTVAAALAARWGRTLRDSDADLQALTGRTAAELAADLGADHLHALEADHLVDAVARTPAPVVAAAASVVEVGRCRAALADRALVVWLDVGPEDLVARQPSGGHRPRYGTDPLRMLRDMDARRRPLFEQVCDIAVRPPPPGAAPAAAAIAALVDDVERRVLRRNDGPDVRRTR